MEAFWRLRSHLEQALIFREVLLLRQKVKSGSCGRQRIKSMKDRLEKDATQLKGVALSEQFPDLDYSPHDR